MDDILFDLPPTEVSQTEPEVRGRPRVQRPLHALPAGQAAILTGKDFFPQLISGPFQQGLTIVFATAAVMSDIAVGASALRGGRYVHEEVALGETEVATP